MFVASTTGCGFALQQASVARSFQSRFGCAAEKVSRVSDGYHVEGCGRTAEYACFQARDGSSASSDTSLGGIVAAAAVAALFAGSDERCVLAHSERSAPSTPVASSAPTPVHKSSAPKGPVMKTRVLFAGGSLRILAKPSEVAQHALVTLHSVRRLPDAPCEAEIFHDGVPVAVLQIERAGPYDAHVVVPTSALEGADEAVRFAGTVCGIDFELDASGRATLGVFAAHFREERARIERTTADALTNSLPH